MTREENRQCQCAWCATGLPDAGIDAVQPGAEQYSGGMVRGAAFGLMAEAVVVVVLFLVYEFVKFWMR